MALTVGELVAFIRADSTQFDRQVDQSGQKFEALGRTVATGTRMLSTAFAAVATGAATVGATVLKIGLDYNKLQQSSRAALTQLLGSAEAANAQMDKLDAFAKTSPFAKQVFIQGQQQLLAFGVAAEKVVPTLDAMQNAVAGAGGSAQTLSELISIFAKISASGKITAQDFIEFGNRGVDAAAMIGRALGKTGSQIREDVTAGALDAGVALDALVQGTQERFAGAADAIKTQMVGAVDKVKAATRDIGGLLAAPFIDPSGGGLAVDWANKVAAALRAVEEKTGPLVDIIVNRLSPALATISPALERIRTAIYAWDLSKVDGQLDRIGSYAPLIASTSGALFALGTRNLPILSQLGLSGLNPVVVAIGALVASSPELRAAGADFLAALEPLVPVARDLGKTGADTAMTMLRDLAPALRDVLTAAAPLIVSLGQELSPALVTAIRAGEPLARALASIAEAAAEMPTPVLLSVAAWAALHGPLAQVAGTISGPLVASFGAMRQTWAASQGVAQALGQNVTLMGTTAITARVGVSALGTALKTAFISNPVGLAVTALTTAVGFFAAAQVNARQRAEELRTTLDQVTGDVSKLTRTWVYDQLETTGRIDVVKSAVEQLGLTMNEALEYATDPASEGARRINELRDAATAGLAATVRGSEEWHRYYTQLSLLNTLMPELTGYTGDVTAEQEALREKLEAVQGATDATTTAVEDHTSALEKDMDAVRESANLALSQADAHLATLDAQDRLTDAIARAAEVEADATATTQEKEQAHRAVEQALIDVAQAYGTETDTMVRNNSTAYALDQTLRTQRETFIANAIEIGKTREEAEALADQYGLIPNKVVTEVIAEAAAAQATIDTFIRTNTGRKIKVTVDATGITTYRYTLTGPAAQADGGLWDGSVRRFADGGISGAGQRVPRVSQIQRGGANIVWAEPETGWEAYISGKPSQRHRSLALLDEVAARLGQVVIPLADGAVLGRAPVNAPAAATAAPSVTNVYLQVDASKITEVMNLMNTIEDARRIGRQRNGT